MYDFENNFFSNKFLILLKFMPIYDFEIMLDREIVYFDALLVEADSEMEYAWVLQFVQDGSK